MGKCQADDANRKRWESTVGGKPDGKIKIKKETGGAFDGTHEHSNKELKGTCMEATQAGRSDKIQFTVNDNKHLYLGVFISSTKIEGFRINLPSITKSRKRPQDNGEDWVAVKVSGGT